MTSAAARIALCVAALLLCLCSIVQLELATTVVQRSMKVVTASKAEPPLAVRLLLPSWLTLSRTPWEVGLCVAYAVLVLLSFVRNFQRNAVLIVLLWLACNTLFFVLIWVASLLYKTCCV